MGYDFTFNHNITRGPLCIDVNVQCQYNPATRHNGASVEYLTFEADESDMTALGSAWPAVSRMIVKDVFEADAFEQTAMVEAIKLGMDKFDENPADRFDGFDRVACGYR